MKPIHGFSLVVSFFVFALFFLSSFSSPLPPLSPTGSLTLVNSLPQTGSLAGVLPVVGWSFPVDDISIPLDMEGFLTLYQPYDSSALISAKLKVDGGSWIDIPVSKIRITSSNGRFLELPYSYRSPGGSEEVGPGLHTLQFQLKTQALNNVTTPVITYRIQDHPEDEAIFGGEQTYSSLSFSSSTFSGMDCTKKPECTREIVVYIPIQKNDTDKTFTDRITIANESLDTVQKVVLSKACVTLKRVFKKIILGDGETIPGYSTGTRMVTNSEQFFHHLHDSSEVKVVDEKGVETTFNDEIDTWSKGAIPWITPDDYLQVVEKKDGELAGRTGVTFLVCHKANGDKSDPTKPCLKNAGTYATLSPITDPETASHEIGHKSFTDTGWSMMSKGSVTAETHHNYDYGFDPVKNAAEADQWKLPPKTIMDSDVIFQEGKDYVTEKQATGLYEACVLKGVLQVNTTSVPIHYQVDRMRTGGSGAGYSSQEKSCAINSGPGNSWKPGMACKDDCFHFPGTSCWSDCKCHPGIEPNPNNSGPGDSAPDGKGGDVLTD